MSRSSSPVDSDDEMRLAMKQVTPTVVRTGTKRPHTNLSGQDDADSDDAAAPRNLSLSNQNLVMAAKRYGERKRLRGDQIAELESFVNVSSFPKCPTDPAPLREVKLMANGLALANQLEQIVAAKPPFELSDDLQLNIKKYAPAILLSERLGSYKGDVPTEALMEIIKRLRFSIPDGLEHIPADWNKVISFAEYCLTQKRATMKKAIRASLKPVTDKDTKVVTYAEDTKKHDNIYKLASAIVKGTNCTVNVILCSRVALMRKVYLKHPDSKFWDKLDAKLDEIREDADGDPKQLVRGFRHVLEQDQKKHGKKDYKDSDIQDAVDNFQQKVDDIIDVNAATTADDDGEPDAEPSEG
ncbi:hypothetical protein R3P38DRAFT_2630067 [Favolaschia claudopus]|uniref:Uncharacterized protein n=1 Tax=Favolaschia claudopus TaxID=2862362 RepID=A0AAW0B5B1_9AGAR